MRMIIAGGGTGGHLFPAIALAEEMVQRSSKTEVLFIGVRNGIEARVLPDEGWPVRFITAEGVKGRGLMALLRGVIKMTYGTVQSLGIIRGFKPSCVLGVGGYVSAPALIAARLLGISTVIHEQNSMPGLANRMLGKISHKVFLTYSGSKRFFFHEKVMITGNPVRKKILDAFKTLDKSKSDDFTLFVFGGSRGAGKINDLAPEAINEFDMKVKRELKVIHQTGSDDFKKVKKAYEKNGINAEIHSFIKDMAQVYMEADLVICRAGATTISELLVAGKPSLLIPYPFAADDHQRKNAEAVVAGGAAKMISEDHLSAKVLAGELKGFYADKDGLADMAGKAKAMARPDASRLICDEIERLVNGKV